MANVKETTRIAFLDYLRIFAFISVLIGHKFYTNIVDALTNNNVHATAKKLGRVISLKAIELKLGK